MLNGAEAAQLKTLLILRDHMEMLCGMINVMRTSEACTLHTSIPSFRFEPATIIMPRPLQPIYHLPKTVYKEFFGDVVLAVGVLESEVELVISVKHVETLVGRGTWTLLGATGPVDVHRYVLLQFVCIL
jgi:hypothetical protein